MNSTLFEPPLKFKYISQLIEADDNCVKILAVIRKVQLNPLQNQPFMRISVHDATDSIQVVFYTYQGQIQYRQKHFQNNSVRLPTQGDSIIITGQFYTKIYQGIKWKKLKGYNFELISFEREMFEMSKMQKQREIKTQYTMRNTFPSNQIHQSIKKINKKPFILSGIQSRTLVLCTLYKFFIHNGDFNDYIFAPNSLTKKIYAKNYLKNENDKRKSSNISEVSQSDFENVFIKGTQQLFQRIFEKRQLKDDYYLKKYVSDQKSKGQRNKYIIYRQFFKKMQNTILEEIRKEQKISCQTLFKKVNQSLNIVKENDQIFNITFIQCILQELLLDQKIWKDSDRLISIHINI